MSSSTKLFLWTIFIFSIFILIGHFKNRNQDLISPLIGFGSKENLKNVIEPYMRDTKGKYGIFIKNLKSGESFFLNEHQTFEAGSLYKLWVMGGVFEKIKEGNLKEEDILEDKIENLNLRFEIASSEAELKTGEISMSVKSALEQIITISHNYAALLLTTEVGVKKIAGFLKAYDINNSSVGSEIKTNPSDIGKFFEKLYKGEIVNQEYSQKMLDILSRQKIRDRIPKLLPEGIKVAHKTADLGFFEHDGGIVFTPSGDYIIVILTESDSPKAAGEAISKISKATYDYFNQN